MIPTIRQHPKEPVRIFSLMRWGLIPYWAKDASIGLKTINAMSETAAVKPVFRDAFKYRRCLIPADGFYEWKKNRTETEAGVQLWHVRRLRIRVRGIVGPLAPTGQYDTRDLCNPDDTAEFSRGRSTRPDAGHFA